jgi:hypothetical protein
MLTRRARAPVEALCERSFGMDARVKPGNDEGNERERTKKNEKERKKKIRRRNADRRNGSILPCLTGTAAPQT